jgi:hypothetical protein
LGREKLTLKITDDDTQPFQHEIREGVSKEGKKKDNHYLKYLKKMEVADQESGETETFKF